MFQLSSVDHINYLDREEDRLSSCLAREACQHAEMCVQHQLQANPDHGISSGIFAGPLQTDGATTTSSLLAPLEGVVHGPRNLNSKYNVFSIVDTGEPPDVPSAMFQEVERQTTQASALLEEGCGRSNHDNIWKLAGTESRGRASDSKASGKASLFNVLLSLGYPKHECYSLLAPQVQTIPSANTIWQPSKLQVEDVSVHNSPGNPVGLADENSYITRSLSLDRNVESNTLPFILNAYALWAIRMMFDPHRIIGIGRTYVFRHYAASESSRWKLKLVSDFAWTAGGSTAYDLGGLSSFMIFQARMCQQFLTATCKHESRESLDQHTALDSFTFAHELFSMAFKHLPLSNILSLMQLAAPVFRCACPDSREELVHLPSLLLQHDISLRYYSTFDILISVITNRPMFFRYNTSFTPELPESRMYIQDYFGMQWFYGVPDRLVVTLARMNALREDYGDRLDERITRELELEIRSFRPVLGKSNEPTLIASRIVVQECWRQAAFIYLYMGLCGANSLDVRVRLVQATFMKLFQGVEPGRNPDVFLILPIAILGLATHLAEEQSLIRRRMLNQPECSRYPTSGNDILKILNEIWTRPNFIEPVVWYDLRVACLRVTGM
ncbi:unnamed protein product [Rhizoctonia solani]|nr:unnamed protein product [Rhizoctonia solani]